MIAQILNDEFLLGAAEDTRLELKRFVEQRERRETVAEGPLSLVDDEQIREVIEELDRAVLAHEARVTESKDTWICMPREPILAILQSELTRVVSDQRPAAIVEDAGITRSGIADDPGERTDGGRRAFGKYEVTRPKILSDPRWLWSGVVIAWNKFKRKADFGGLADHAVSIADDARVLLVGDWGSGIERAQAVAAQMRLVLEQGMAEDREQHVIHLGDVYYTGAREEYENNFLRYWPVKEGEGIGSYALCGNHDMYQGGHAYYATALADPRFARQEHKSVFMLRSSVWQLLCLDTSYEDKRLFGGQAAWIEEQLQAAPGSRTALLSHHQPWSAYEDAGKELRSEVKDILASGRIDAWFWGHEHRCLVYEPRENVKLSSCVGHGGIPEYLVAAEGKPYPPGLRYDYRRKHGHGIEPWNTFGFAVLELDGYDLNVKYIAEDGGQPHHEEELRHGV